jgi:hypothetical protein
VKRDFVTLPMMLPRLSDKAAAQLLDILAMLHESVQHHYAAQVHRWHRQQCSRHRPPPRDRQTALPLPDEPPF